MSAPDYFMPDRDPRGFYPLQGLMRAPPASVAARYVDTLTSPGALVIDPFGATPTVARVACALGRRVIVVESNPLWAWLAHAMVALPPASEIVGALTRLGDALKDDTPLRVHISQLYMTTCASCGQPTPADYFIHARGAGPIQRHYTCAHCGETRDDSATEDDRARLAAFDAHGFHYHFAFERVVPPDNLHADRIRKMLDLYTPRNLYALVTLTSKIDSLFHATREQNILRLLLLHLLDRGTSFYAAPDAVAQLTAHKRFIEFNLWRESEIAAHALANYPVMPNLAESPAEVVAANTPRAFVGRGDAKTIAHEIPRGSVALGLTAPPTRRLAVWALSYFWGAWVLGRTAVQTLAPFLDSRKDATWEWHWYLDGLTESLGAMAGLLHTDALLVFAFTESWHQVIETLLLAATRAHLQLESFLFQPRLGDLPHAEFDDIRGDYRVAFTPTPGTLLSRGEGTHPADLEKQIRGVAFAASSDILARRGEALPFSWMHHAAFTRVTREGLLAQALDTRTKTAPGRFVHDAVIAGLREGYAHDFDHYENPEQYVWLRRAKLDPPLIDRVDEAVCETLSHGKPVSHEDLEDALYRQFPGDLTPEAGLIRLCASAYADEREGTWRWRQVSDGARAPALEMLARLGERLGYVVERPSIIAGEAKQPPTRDSETASPESFDSATLRPGSLSATTGRHSPFDLVWKSDGEIGHAFIWRDRARFIDVMSIHIVPACGYIVVPETRVPLLLEKTRRLPHLADAFYASGWNFVRVPFIERMLQAEKVERSDMALIVGLVPPATEGHTQLGLF